MVGWNWLDWTLAGVVIVSVATAAIKGFVRELVSLASLVAGIAIAALGYRWAARWFEDVVRSHEVALGVGFLVLFLIVILAGEIVIVVARKIIKSAGLEAFDRYLGAVFGIVRGVVVDSVFLMTLVAFAIKPEAVQRSVLAPYVVTGARVIAFLMPSDLKSHFQDGFEKLRLALARQDKKRKD